MNRQIGVILGKQGSGKSELVKKFIIPRLCSDRPIIIFDSMAEYGDSISVSDFLIRSITSGSVTGKNCIKITSKEDAARLFKFIYVNRLRINVIIEESDKYCSPYFIDPYLSDLINYGRHHNTGLVFISRRAAKLHRDITSQCDYLLSFAQHESIDIKALKHISDLAVKLQSLDKYCYIPIIKDDYWYKFDPAIYTISQINGQQKKVKKL